MGKHVVVGSGQVGNHLAGKLLARGHEVTVVTRSGSGPAGATRVAADVADQARLIEVTRGADVLYNCVNPRYHRWLTDWPPMAASFLGAAEATGAVLVILGNLYPYGPVTGPMTEDLPLASTNPKFQVRAKMWADALAAHEAGRIRVTEVRGSDYFGPGATDQSYLGDRFLVPLREGRTIQLVWPADMPHSWTYLPDVADALIVAGADERAWGRPWHVPTGEPRTFREMGERMAALLGRPAPRLMRLPWPAVQAAGLFSPMIGELRHTRYQFVAPYVLDSSAFQRTFGLAPTPLDEALKATLVA
ncbi:NAD-dependent epimerase/dehydratase family protein [Nonomuraea cavernae]|uniref:NAD-dependent epimerase n=1 Tax=Nonomuraea cavernae TaxID=2045107 RepID=A0A917YTT0_9ACTN|nr:NAD-dependent epimerase/dehydratase family protein [Nonomuraea cavernae]MCA2185402.1 NAD-dependent epimerase/dehydratase family protein [Nonomuraea cavernae]GGO66357.1 NAD-dependent epimerase [Nonomuraea cavernae]